MLNRCRGSHMQLFAHGRSPLSTKERVGSIIMSVNDCWSDQASSLKTGVTPVLPLRDQTQIQDKESTERWRDVRKDYDWRYFVDTTDWFLGCGRSQNIKLISLCYVIAYVFRLRLKRSRMIFPEGRVM